MPTDTSFFTRVSNIASATLLTLVIFSFILCAGAMPSHAQDKQHITAVLLTDFPPLYMTNAEGEPEGFALDTFKAIAAEAGLEYDLIVVKTIPEAEEAIRTGKADVIPGIGLSQTRKNEFYTTAAFNSFPISIFVRSDTKDIQSKADLDGRYVGTVTCNTAYKRLQHLKGIRPTIFQSLNEGIFNLLAGNIDALIFPEPILMHRARSVGIDNKLKIVGSPIVELKPGYLYHKSNTELGAKLSHAITRYMGSQEYAENYHKWWGKPTPFWNTSKAMTASVSFFTCAVLLVIFWRYHSLSTLNKELKRAVTAHRATQAKLEASELRLIKAQGIASLGTFERDIQTGLGHWSEGLCRMLGYPVHPDAPPVEDFFKQIHPDDIQEYKKRLENVSSGNSEFSYEFRYRPKGEDEYRYGISRYSFEFSETGVPTRRIGSIQDITDRKHIEAELLSERDRAEAASKVKSEFLANMSHELRTPLNGALGMLQLLELEDLHPTHREYVETAISSCRNLTSLLGDILDLSKVEANKITLDQVVFEPTAIFESVHETFDLVAKEKGIDFAFKPSQKLPFCLEGDPARLRQVLFNLVGNALKFTDSGSVIVEVVPIFPEDKEKVRVLFSISDTGMGIADNMLEKVFGAFTQADGSHTRRFSGSGLGLHIVKRLVELMNGNINIESIEGEGTTVHFSALFGAALGTQATCDPEEYTPNHKGAHGKHILVAEDERTNRIVLCRFLEKLGHKTDWVSNGEEVLARLVMNDYDLIFMDIQMPVMNGIQATHTIRNAQNLGPKKDIPIVALTAHAMTGDRESFLAEGMTDYLSKPVDIGDLKKVLFKLFEEEPNDSTH